LTLFLPNLKIESSTQHSALSSFAGVSPGIPTY
jgi:hypothetical protein